MIDEVQELNNLQNLQYKLKSNQNLISDYHQLNSFMQQLEINIMPDSLQLQYTLSDVGEQYLQRFQQEGREESQEGQDSSYSQNQIFNNFSLQFQPQNQVDLTRRAAQQYAITTYLEYNIKKVNSYYFYKSQDVEQSDACPQICNKFKQFQ